MQDGLSVLLLKKMWQALFTENVLDPLNNRAWDPVTDRELSHPKDRLLDPQLSVG